MSGEQANPVSWAPDQPWPPNLIIVKRGRRLLSVGAGEFVALPGGVEYDLRDAEPGDTRLLDSPLETFSFFLVHWVLSCTYGSNVKSVSACPVE